LFNFFFLIEMADTGFIVTNIVGCRNCADHWLIDLMICNLAGMVLGMVTCRYLECTLQPHHRQHTRGCVLCAASLNTTAFETPTRHHIKILVRRYDWTGASEGPAGIRTHLKRALAQFSPMRWTRYAEQTLGQFLGLRDSRVAHHHYLLLLLLSLLRYEWSVFSSVRRFFMVAMMIVMMEVVEMNGFFLKYVLWYIPLLSPFFAMVLRSGLGLTNRSRPLCRIPPANPLNTMRLLLFCLLSIPGTRVRPPAATPTDSLPNCKFSSRDTRPTSAALHEWYAYVVAFEKTQTRRLGKDMWLVIAIMGVEVRATHPTELPRPSTLFRAARIRLTYVCVCVCLRACVCVRVCVVRTLMFGRSTVCRVYEVWVAFVHGGAADAGHLGLDPVGHPPAHLGGAPLRHGAHTPVRPHSPDHSSNHQPTNLHSSSSSSGAARRRVLGE
jgi:hypothetical protein